MAAKYHTRQISFPSRSHPTTLAIEEELNKLRAWEASSTSTSGSICIGLSGVEELYRCMDGLLNMASTQQVLSQHQHEKYVDELLDGSMRLLDICGIARDTMLQANEHIRALQCALRRRKGDSSFESSISNYTRFRKSVAKDAKKLMVKLRQMDNKLGKSPLLDQDHHLSAVIGVLREVNVMNISIFQSLLSFLSASVNKTKQSRWSLVSKLMHKGAIACEERRENVNELESAEAALCKYASANESDAKKMQTALKKLEALEMSIEDLENGLKGILKSMTEGEQTAKLPARYNVRSISFPARSDPSAKRFEEERIKNRCLKEVSSSNSETICTSLSSLTELYRCIGDLFNLPVIQQALAQQHHKKLVSEWLDGSVRCLDICGKTRDAVLLIKEGVRELQSALRRKKAGDLSIEHYVSAYFGLRKKMKKEITKSLPSIKEMDNIFRASPLLDLNHRLSVVAKLLKEANLITGSIFGLLFSFLSAPVALNPKPKRWSLVLKLLKKGVSAKEAKQGNMNELESVDTALSKLLLQNESEDDEAERIECALTGLEAVEVIVEDFEKELENLFRRMIQSRASLLNVLSI